MKAPARKIEEVKMWRSLYRCEFGNAKALLRQCIKLEKKQKTFYLSDWEDWMRQYEVKA